MGNSSSTSEVANEPGYLSQASAAYDQVVNAIIRPPRCEYVLRALGPPAFEFVGSRYHRKDFTLVNKRGMRLQCSHWEPIPANRRSETLPCVIYMHGNSSGRVEALPILSLILSLGATLVTFDFSGSGHSEGEWVSLGVFERDDLGAVIEYLRRPESGISTIALYGRSMGAATCLLHAERDPSIAGMVLDSPFSDLTKLAQEIVERGRNQGMFAPSILVSIAIRFIRSSVKERAGFDINDVSPISSVERSFVPAMFVAAKGDEFIPPHHAQELHDLYASDGKNIVLVDGDHNSLRPRFLYDSVSIFLQTYLQIRETDMIMDGMEHIGKMPWNYPYARSRGYNLNSVFDIFSNRRASPAPNEHTDNNKAGAKAIALNKALAEANGHTIATPEQTASTIIKKEEKTYQKHTRRGSHEGWIGGDNDNEDDDSSDEDNAILPKDIGVGMGREQQVAVESTIFKAFGAFTGKKKVNSSPAPAPADTKISAPIAKKSSAAVREDDIWMCSHCDFPNGFENSRCVACNMQR